MPDGHERARRVRKCDTHDEQRSRTSPSMPSSSYSAPTAAIAPSSMWVTSRGNE